MNSLNAALVAYLMVFFQQAVVALGWLVGASVLPAALRRAALCWAAHAAGGGMALLVFLYAGLLQGSPGLRALGNLLMVGSLIALQRGLWHFARRPLRWRAHSALLAATLGVSWLGLSPAFASLRIAVVSGLLCGLALWISADVYRHARQHIPWRPAALVLVLPLLVGAMVFLLRMARTVLEPEEMRAEFTADTVFNVGFAMAYQVLVLAFQLSLMGLVVAHLTGDLRRASRYDALTGLLNRSATDEALADEVQRARRLKQPFAVLMIDADHFKALNDRYGHAAGDRALQHMATLMMAQMRDIDRFGRWGGEEFVAVLPASEIAEAGVLAERLRERVAALPLYGEDGPIAMTVSVGAAQWRGDGEAPAELLERADAALYRAKSAGRNRVEMAP
jgi:diguanylate cyclase (GGDEF)-like protein